MAVPRSRFAVFAAIALLGCLADLATKKWIFEELGLPGGETRWVVDGFFGFQTSLNPGALFGMGKGMVWLFAGLSVLAAVTIVYWLFVGGAASDLLLTVALALVTAGILGNLYDRLGLWADAQVAKQTDVHVVRDWILFTYRGRVWPNFNLADSFLVCGAALLFWHAFRRPAPKATTE